MSKVLREKSGKAVRIIALVDPSRLISDASLDLLYTQYARIGQARTL